MLFRSDRVMTMDLHAGQIQGYFDIPVDHLSAIKTLSNYFAKIVKSNKGEDFVVVSPDLGGVARARNFADFLGLLIAIIEKTRPRPNVSEVMNIISKIKGKNVITNIIKVIQLINIKHEPSKQDVQMYSYLKKL